MSKNTELHNFVLYKINPNEDEKNGDVYLDRNVDGRIFSGVKIELKEHSVLIYNEKSELVGVFSLHHFYILNRHY